MCLWAWRVEDGQGGDGLADCQASSVLGVDAFPWPWVRSWVLSSLQGRADSAQDKDLIENERILGRSSFWEAALLGVS